MCFTLVICKCVSQVPTLLVQIRSAKMALKALSLPGVLATRERRVRSMRRETDWAYAVLRACGSAWLQHETDCKEELSLCCRPRVGLFIKLIEEREREREREEREKGGSDGKGRASLG